MLGSGIRVSVNNLEVILIDMEVGRIIGIVVGIIFVELDDGKYVADFGNSFKVGVSVGISVGMTLGNRFGIFVGTIVVKTLF